jgi:ribonuclease HI
MLTAFTDGAARGKNGQGPASSAFWVVNKMDGSALVEQYRKIGVATNNVAEFTALIMFLEWAVKRGSQKVEIFSDSELMVRQINGIYAVRNEGIRPLFEKATYLLEKIPEWYLNWVPRDQNSHADKLANQALDEK